MSGVHSPDFRGQALGAVHSTLVLGVEGAWRNIAISLIDRAVSGFGLAYTNVTGNKRESRVSGNRRPLGD